VSAPEKNREIDDLAAQWVARSDRGPLSEQEARDLEVWLEADMRHLGAYARAMAVSVMTEKVRALGPHFDVRQYETEDKEANRTEDEKPTRRRLLLMGGIAAAAASLALLFGVRSKGVGRTFETRLGETLVVPLQDGSVITLNTASKIAVNYTKESRNIQLMEGEALFDVAKRRAWPFVVHAKGTQVVAVGTSFTVQVLPERPVTVLVREGIVELSRPDVPTAPAVQVAQNTRAVAPDDAPIAAKSLTETEVNRELNWRVGRLAFEGNTLREAAETFARYSNTRIVIDDPSIASETITGLFVANDPIGFSKAVAISLNIRADVGEGEVRLRR
jgi:transmembrane sensor